MDFNRNAHSLGTEVSAGTTTPQNPSASARISCTECRRRKQKCNLVRPCDRCVSRDRANYCVFLSRRQPTSKSTKSTSTSRSPAVSTNVEAATIAQSVASPAQSWVSSLTSSTSSHNIFESLQFNNEPQQKRRRSALATEKHSRWGGIRQLSDLISGGTGLDVDGADATITAFETPSEGIFSALDANTSILCRTLVQTIKAELPAREVVDMAVWRYFEHTNSIQDTMHRGWFDAAHDRFWEAFSSACTLPKVTRSLLSGLSFAPLLFMVLAIDIATQQSLLESRQSWWASRTTTVCLDGLHSKYPILVMAKVLQASFLVAHRHVNESYEITMTAVTSAMAIGLNKNSSAIIDPLEAEMCRRIWSYCYHSERVGSVALGKPLLISPDFVKAMLPRNLHDEEIQHESNEKPLSDITPALFAILRMRLGDVIGEISRCCFGTSQPGYSEVLRLDNMLLTFIKELPLPFQLGTMYTDALDKAYPFIAIQRYILWSELYHIRITLHARFFILRDFEARYSFSKTVAVTTAQSDLVLQLSFHGRLEDSLPMRANLSLYCMFYDAVIISLEIIQIQPSWEDQEQSEHGGFKTRMELFNQYYEKLRSQLPDPSSDESYVHASTTRKEMEIIDRLRTQIEASWNSDHDHGSGGRSAKSMVDRINVHGHRQQSQLSPPSSASTITLQAPDIPLLSSNQDSTPLDRMSISLGHETMNFENDIDLMDCLSNILSCPVDDCFTAFEFDQGNQAC